MGRVLQAAGRVIRSETDRGVVLLIDERFDSARYHSLLPAHLRPVPVKNPKQIKSAVGNFWRKKS
jgi:Rad3-related DNA helicase